MWAGELGHERCACLCNPGYVWPAPAVCTAVNESQGLPLKEGGIREGGKPHLGPLVEEAAHFEREVPPQGRHLLKVAAMVEVHQADCRHRAQAWCRVVRRFDEHHEEAAWGTCSWSAEGHGARQSG